ncbi:MAG: HAD family phosphatase [Sedimentisphaerales bacterium]|nr:HAD family phosphatase [Sedimentisphaerales bacterium]
MNNKTVCPKAVIFDLDGVLIDTGQFHRQAWYDLAECHGWTMTDKLFYQTFGMQNYQILPMLSDQPLTDEKILELSEWKESRYRKLVAGKLTLLDGAEQLTKNLKQNNFRLAIGSSTIRANLDFMLEHIPVAHYFDALVTDEDVENGKPAPDTFLAAARKLNIPPVACVVVEDAIPGVQAAKAAQMPVIAITTTRQRSELSLANKIIDSLTQLTPADFDTLLAG